MIEKYNKILDDIVREFAKRFYKESFNDEEYEYDLI
jgi:hypothetical protein